MPKRLCGDWCCSDCDKFLHSCVMSHACKQSSSILRFLRPALTLAYQQPCLASFDGPLWLQQFWLRCCYTGPLCWRRPQTAQSRVSTLALSRGAFSTPPTSLRLEFVPRRLCKYAAQIIRAIQQPKSCRSPRICLQSKFAVSGRGLH